MWVINGTLLTILTEASILNRDEMTFGMGFICDHFFDQCPDINQARTAMIVSIILFTILHKAGLANDSLFKKLSIIFF